MYRKLNLCGLSALCLLAGFATACDDDDSDENTGRPDASQQPDAGSTAGKPSGSVAGSKAPQPAKGDPIELRFAGKVGKQPFACGTTYDAVGTPPRSIEPVDFRMYVHDVRLVTEKGDEVAVELDQDKTWQHKDVALLDFEDGKGACTQGDSVTNTTLRGRVTAGEYTAVKFRLGIPTALNHTDLSSQPSPLNKSSLFWGWNMGHIFLAATSRTPVAVTDEDAGVPNEHDAGADHGDGEYEGGAGHDSETRGFNDHSSHVGATGCDGNPIAGKPVTSCKRENRPEYTLSGFDREESVIVVDFAEIKRGSDLAANKGCHSFTAETCTVPFERLGIDFESGQTSDKPQTAFRIE